MKFKFTGIEFWSDIDESLSPDTQELADVFIEYAESLGHTIEMIDPYWFLNNKNTNDIVVEICVTEGTETMKSGSKIEYEQNCFSVLLRAYKNSKVDGRPHICRSETMIYHRFEKRFALEMLRGLLPAFPLWAHPVL